jgi:hypothetical protein
MAAAIALGAASMSDIAVLAHLAPVLGTAPSGPTVRRALDLAGTAAMLDRIARARARAHVWTLIEGTATGFPWLAIAGKTLTGGVVIDMDATLVTARSDKQGAAPTWKKGYGFHPLGAWCANTRECLAMLLRPGNAGSNTFTDHKDVLAAAIRQVPARFRRKILVRVDGAGASHELIKHLLSMSSPRRMLLFTCGWMITAADEDAIRQVPQDAWEPGIGQDGAIEEDKDVAEITYLLSRAGNWPGGLRWIARRVGNFGQPAHPRVHEDPAVKLTAYPGTVRQLIVTGLGRDTPTVIITNDRDTTTRNLIRQYARRMTIEQRLAEIIRAFCADALSSTVNLNVDLDVVLCVLAQALLAALRARLPGYHAVTPDVIQRRFLETPGQIITDRDAITVRLERRAYSPVLRQASLPASTTIPWWSGQTIRYEYA